MNSNERAEKLESIPLDDARSHHDWLRECFAQELEKRLSDTSYENFESIYHCALLLHIISDLDDVHLMYSAKCSGDMDLGSGFDWQFLFVRDPKTLKHYAVTNNHNDLAQWIDDYTPEYLEEDMKDWLQGIMQYHRNT